MTLNALRIPTTAPSVYRPANGTSSSVKRANPVGLPIAAKPVAAPRPQTWAVQRVKDGKQEMTDKELEEQKRREQKKRLLEQEEEEESEGEGEGESEGEESETSDMGISDYEDTLTDEEEDTEEYKLQFLEDRKDNPFHSIYSYATSKNKTKPGTPEKGEGPHTIAFCATLYGFDQIVANGDYKSLEAAEKSLEQPEGITTIIKSEVTNKKVKMRLQNQYDSDYATYRKDAKKAVDAALAKRGDKELLAAAALALIKAGNLHPYAVSGWRAGKKVSAKASAGKGESVHVRKKGSIFSISRSGVLSDGSDSIFANPQKAKAYREKKLRFLFKSKNKMKRAFATWPGMKAERAKAKSKKNAKKKY